MIMRIVITTTAVCLAISSLATATAEQDNLQQSAEISETNVQQQNVDPNGAGINVNVTAIAARLINDYVTPTICSVSSEFCAKHQLRKSKLSILYYFILHDRKQKLSFLRFSKSNLSNIIILSSFYYSLLLICQKIIHKIYYYGKLIIS